MADNFFPLADRMDIIPEKLTKKHQQLTHSDELVVVSHSQRQQEDWFINSLMIEGVEIPFKYRRTKKYKTLQKGQRVNLTYYPATESVAGLSFDYFKVVRVRLS